MGYTKTTWTESTPRSLANLNKMETQYDEAVAQDIRQYSDEELRIQTVDSLPGGYTEGRAVLLSTDNRVYFQTSAGWFSDELKGDEGDLWRRNDYIMSGGEEVWIELVSGQRATLERAGTAFGFYKIGDLPTNVHASLYINDTLMETVNDTSFLRIYSLEVGASTPIIKMYLKNFESNDKTVEYIFLGAWGAWF